MEDKNCGEGDFPLSFIEEEINTNIKLKHTNYVIPLQAVFKDSFESRKGTKKIIRYTFHLIFEYGITLKEFMWKLKKSQIT